MQPCAVNLYYGVLLLSAWYKLTYTSEPPIPNAWNQLKRETSEGFQATAFQENAFQSGGAGWYKLLYAGE